MKHFNKRFCSRKCRYIGNEGFSGKKHTPESKSKISQNRTGKYSSEKHWAWKGGNSRNYKTGYYSTEYKKWRIAIFERDSYRCQGCNKVGGYLTAHHIKSFAKFPKLRFNIDNGITLCEDCHKLTDNYKGKGNRK